MPTSAAKHGITATKIQNLKSQCTGNSRHADFGSAFDARSRPNEGATVRAHLFLREEEVCLVAQASIPRVLQLSIRRSRGEAIGRIQRLIGTPDRFFYTGKPPAVLGGSYLLRLFIHPFAQVFAGDLAFPFKLIYPTPLGYMSR